MPDTPAALGGLTHAQAVQLDRIEQMLQMLLDALAEHDESDEGPALTLDGTYAGQERAPGTPL